MPKQVEFSIDETWDREGNLMWTVSLTTETETIHTESFYSRDEAVEYVDTHWPNAVEA